MWNGPVLVLISNSCSSAPMRVWFHVVLLSASQCPPLGGTLRLPIHMSGYYSRSRRERGDYCAGWRRRGFEGMTRGKCARAFADLEIPTQAVASMCKHPRSCKICRLQTGLSLTHHLHVYLLLLHTNTKMHLGDQHLLK